MLIWGSDQFVNGAAGLAKTLKVSPLIIGLVIVGFGTSAPEMLVAAVAGWDGDTSLAIGNALGSNITNIALVIGVTAMLTPLTVRSALLKREFPALFLIMGVTLALFMDGELSRMDGVILLAGLVVFIAWMVHLGKRSQIENHDPLEDEFIEELPAEMPIRKAIIWLLIGLVALLIGAKLVVWGAVAIAHHFGVSDLVIGLTIVAIGTSLPELDIAIGNILGSNMFNLLGVLGIPAVLHPARFDHQVLIRDFPIMIILTIVLFLLSRFPNDKEGGTIGRIGGAGLTIAFISYLFLLYAMAS